jgi:hypothetical protein
VNVFGTIRRNHLIAGLTNSLKDRSKTANGIVHLLLQSEATDVSNYIFSTPILATIFYPIILIHVNVLYFMIGALHQ